MFKTIIFLIPLLILSCSYERTTKIGLQPYDNFNKSLIDSILSTISGVYGFKVFVLPEKTIPENAFINIKSPRYRADTILRILKQTKPDSIDYIIGLTHKDISTTKKDAEGNIKKPEYEYSDWGVFGLGYRPGPSCLISTYRIKNTSQKKFIERLKKVSVHELGHNLGLKHCNSDKCLMRDAAETIKTVDYVDLVLCNKCKQKIE